MPVPQRIGREIFVNQGSYAFLKIIFHALLLLNEKRSMPSLSLFLFFNFSKTDNLQRTNKRLNVDCININESIQLGTFCLHTNTSYQKYLNENQHKGNETLKNCIWTPIQVKMKQEHN